MPWAGCTCERARREKDRKFCTCFYSDGENVKKVRKDLHRLWHILFPGSFTFRKVAVDLSLYFNYSQQATAPIIFRIGGILATVPDEIVLDATQNEIVSIKIQKRITKMSGRLDDFMDLSHMKNVDHLLNDISHIWIPPYLYIAAYRQTEKMEVYERIS